VSDDLEHYRSACERSLNWHGNRTAAELLAEVPTDLGIDRYGTNGPVEALEREICRVLGKPAAVFMPSGTMAQQIAIRIHADRSGVRTFAFHPTCHLELHEDEAYQRLHGLVGKPVGARNALLTLDDLRGVDEPLAAVLFELPQREIGGQLPSWEELEAQTAFVRTQGIALHLDGARLWECGPYYRRAPARIAALFDTVYVSFYKGLGGLAGCCLAGERDVINEARVWRKRHGGTLHGLWPNAASGLAALRKRLPMMPAYYEHARAIADALRVIPNVAIIPNPPQTPMMHLRLHVDPHAFLSAALRIAKEQSIFTWAGTSATDDPSLRAVELTVGDATLRFTPDEVARLVRQLVS
jgi:threonine aldolase